MAVRSQNRENGSAALVADSPIAMIVQYLGSSASATITVAAGDITFKQGTAGAEAVDTTVGASGVVADGTYTTLGAMVDAINLSPNWHAELVDALRADVSTAALKALSEYTFSPKTEVVNLYVDTSAALTLTYRISARRTNVNKSSKGKQAFFKAANALVNVVAGTLTLNVYEITPAGVIVNTLGTWPGTDNTDLAVSIASGQGELFGAVGNPLLVRYTCSADLPDTGAYLRVAGYIQ